MEVPAAAISSKDGNGEANQINCFKNIPMRLYEGDKPMIQKLIKPTVNVSKNSWVTCIIRFSLYEFTIFLISVIYFRFQQI